MIYRYYLFFEHLKNYTNKPIRVRFQLIQKLYYVIIFPNFLRLCIGHNL